MFKTYLQPLSLASRGTVALEYKLFVEECDMRTNYSKQIEKYALTPHEVEKVMHLISVYNLRFKNNRLLMTNGDVAYKFARELCRMDKNHNAG